MILYRHCLISVCSCVLISAAVVTVFFCCMLISFSIEAFAMLVMC